MKKFLFFDLDRTLVDHDQAEREAVRTFYQKHRDRISCTPDELFDRWEEISEEYWERYSNDLLGYHEQRLERLRAFLELDSQQVSQDELEDLFEQYLSMYRDACELFPEVRKSMRQLPVEELGLITNGGQKIQYQKLRKTDLIDWFSVIVCSNEVKRPKPYPFIFEEATKRAEREPHECVYVGDHYEHDIIAAQKQGFDVIWINREEKRIEDGNEVPEISELTELPSLLNDLHS